MKQTSAPSKGRVGGEVCLAEPALRTYVREEICIINMEESALHDWLREIKRPARIRVELHVQRMNASVRIKSDLNHMCKTYERE